MKKKKRLVADDDVRTLRLVGLVLEREGHEIIVAQTGERALEKARAEDPDLVVLDVAMPGVDGYEVTRMLRASPDTADLPILLFTAKSDVQDKVTGFEAGADDYVTKPIHPAELLSRVEALLLRSSRAHPKEEAPPANVIGFLGSKGGVGTTTLAVNTAVALTQGKVSDQQIVLAELRSGMAAAALQLGLSRHGAIRNILDQPIGKIDTGLVEAQLDQHSTGLLVLTGESEPVGVAARIRPDHGEAIVRHLGGIAGYLLLDLGVGLDEVNRRVLPHCRPIVVTIEPNHISLALAEKLLDEMNQSLNIPMHKIGLVLISRSRSAASFTRDTIEERLKHRLLGLIPPAPELAFQSASQETPMIMLHLDSFVVRQYRTIAEDLIEALSSSSPS
jgi:pilus assembly protein CpaE